MHELGPDVTAGVGGTAPLERCWVRQTWSGAQGRTGDRTTKPSLSAALLLAHLCGPPAHNKPNSQLFSAAQSRDQAGLIFALAAKMVRMNKDLAQAVVIP